MIRTLPWRPPLQAGRGKRLILVEPTRWSPISKGGFPASLFED